MKIFRNGLLTGLLLQLAIGPVFFFIVNLTLQRTMLDGLVAVLAVTIVDYMYITLAILGVGKLLENRKRKKAFGIISSAVLAVFGWIIIRGAAGSDAAAVTTAASSDLLSSFISPFLLGISSPLTIVFFTGLFAAKAVELNYTKRELFFFGLSTGLATVVFMGTTVILISIVGGVIPKMLVTFFNIAIGLVLIGYGAIRMVKIMQNSGVMEAEGG